MHVYTKLLGEVDFMREPQSSKVGYMYLGDVLLHALVAS
jgi:hypothetical protein